MKIKVISIDQDKSRQFAEMIDEYSKRTPWKLETIDLAATSRSNPQQQQEKEGHDIIKHISPNDYIIALDPNGKQLSSEEFANSFSLWQQRGTTHISFIIGGAFGLSNAVKQRANVLLSLSKMTMPHRIAKLVLIEQIYRAYTITQGHPYHK